MRQRVVVSLATAAALVVGGLVAATPAATAAPAATDQIGANRAAQGADEQVSVTEQKTRTLRQEALTGVLNGTKKAEKRGSSTVVKMGKKPAAKGKNGPAEVDQYVELSNERTDRIFVVLAEFGDQRHPSYPDRDTDPNTAGPVRFDGPSHNQIPQPNRNVDNSTLWLPEYSRQHYEDLYFSTNPSTDSLTNFYRKQSSGRYSVEGEVTDWVRVPFNQARYGRSNGFPCGGIICNNAFELVKDGVNQWFNDQLATGKTRELVTAELAQFDVRDRNDFDGDGNFDEPDGYLDHFQIVHAGGDQADADPVYGEDAIWSHRGFAFSSTSTGPVGNLKGGTQVGDTGLWVGDYTMQPENGGVGVFAHEFAHDLGLPDLYDTSGGGQNNVNWWSLMAQQRVSGPGEVLATRVNDMDAWSKLQLGWLDYEVVVAGQNRTLDLGPHEYNSAKAQGAVVVLPDKVKTSQYGGPFAGTRQWWSSKGDDLDNSMSRPIDLTGKSSASITLKARYDIEEDFDYLYAQVSQDGGTTWTSLDGTVNGQPFGRDSGNAPSITGSTNGAWVDLNIPLTSVVGKNVMFRFRYRTDGGLALNGFFADNITITADGATVLSDGAENGNNGWALNGFRTTTGTETQSFDNFYVASNRTYQSYDQYMQTGPYNFGFPDRPKWVEHFPYQTGLLVSYWDTSQADNNTSQHHGEGLILPIDAHPAPIYNLEGLPWRERIAGYDVPFSLSKADSFTLHINGKASFIRGQNAVPLFDDTKQFLYPEQPNAGVTLPATGTTIRVVSQSGTSMRIRIGTR
ncbi:MAG: immune inhibitor A domain-containing protein [Labedaea sp.]